MFSYLRAFKVFDASSAQLIRGGWLASSSRINPSVWIRLTLSLYGSSCWEIIFRPCARRNGAIRGYSPLNRFPGLENSNTHCLSFTGIIELSTSPLGNRKVQNYLLHHDMIYFSGIALPKEC